MPRAATARTSRNSRPVSAAGSAAVGSSSTSTPDAATPPRSARATATIVRSAADSWLTGAVTSMCGSSSASSSRAAAASGRADSHHRAW